MTLEIRVLRRESPDSPAFWQSFSYTPQSGGETVATALTHLSQQPSLTDRDGNPAAPIRWEHSCLQKKCGACAMVINGRPRLACDARLSEYKGIITLEPLKKFPVVADLIVDRSILFENLRVMQMWISGPGKVSEKQSDEAYEAARCLQCGCCLEICPNFYPGGAFFGMASFVPATRLISVMTPGEQQDIRKNYLKHVYEGCGKSLACRDICPAGIDADRLLSKSNAAAVWRRNG